MMLLMALHKMFCWCHCLFLNQNLETPKLLSGGSAIDGDPKMLDGSGRRRKCDALAEITGEVDEGDKYPRGNGLSWKPLPEVYLQLNPSP